MDRQDAGSTVTRLGGKRYRAASRPFSLRACPIWSELGEYPLQDAYIGLRSLTYTQRAARFLSGKGIRADAVRAPWSDGGCAYAVRIRRGELETALVRLREAGFIPGRVYLRERDGTLREAGL